MYKLQILVRYKSLLFLKRFVQLGVWALQIFTTENTCLMIAACLFTKKTFVFTQLKLFFWHTLNKYFYFVHSLPHFPLKIIQIIILLANATVANETYA